MGEEERGAHLERLDSVHDASKSCNLTLGSSQILGHHGLPVTSVSQIVTLPRIGNDLGPGVTGSISTVNSAKIPRCTKISPEEMVEASAEAADM